MDDQQILKIRAALRKSWSKETSLIFNEQYPYYGQCAQTAIIIQENFGGEILRTEGWPNAQGYGRHFYNRINGIIYDFTAEQFSQIPNYTHNIQYLDIPSSPDEAATEAYPNQIASLRSAFRSAFYGDKN